VRQYNYQSRGLQKRQPQGYLFKTDRYDLFQVIYVCTGELVFAGADTRAVLGPGGIAILRRNSRFRLSCPRIGYCGVAFHALGELPPAFCGLAETLRATSEMRTLAQLMEMQFVTPYPESTRELEGLGRVLAWEAIRLCEKIKRQPWGLQTGAEWAKAARSTLDANVYNVTTAREAIEPLPLSYRQLSRYFTEEYNLSPKQYQLQAKIREAKRLLSETRLSVTMIAMELGFASSQHFATQFKAMAGVTPTCYRKSQPVKPSV